MKPVEKEHCIVFDANTTAYLKRIPANKPYPEYLILCPGDTVKFFPDYWLANITGMPADYELGRKGPNLIVFKTISNNVKVFPYTSKFRITHVDKWEFNHGSFHVEQNLNPSLTRSENLDLFEKNIRKIQAHMENWETEYAIDTL